MGRFGMWFSNFMRGRYGNDDLNRRLMILALVFIIINIILRWYILNFITVILLIYIYCRMFSRNINARYMENQRYLKFENNFKGKFGGNRKSSASGAGNSGGFGFASGKDKNNKILRCPGCGEKLRVPKNAGKINIHCPHCGTSFVKKV